ncbi:MAG: hypothetical protein JXA54_05835 [Candidatus Heimdallarchaeota archaeon]|nr:hypothetical protein [Candidatus Heimdallarchaeota archaeon]
MTPSSSSKSKKITCKFCDKTAEYMKLYNDYFCSKCLRFQTETTITEVKILPIFKLKVYNFNAQKYAYIINNELDSRIGSCERRDLTKFISKKDYDIRYYFFNDINRIVASMDGRTINDIKDANASWKIYNYGRHFLGEIVHLASTDTWQIHDSDGKVLAIRNPDDNQVVTQTAREFTIVSAENNKNILCKITRKIGFQLRIFSDEFDSLLGWGLVIAIHRRYYL